MKIVTVGTGWIVEEFIEAAKTVSGVEVVSNYSRDLSKAKTFSEKVGVSNYCDSFESIIKDTNINTVYIATPNALHYKQAKFFLENGKNVIVEKTIVAELEHAEELYKIAKNNKLMIFEAISNIHMPNFHEIKDNLPKLGKIRMVTSNFSMLSDQYDDAMNGRVANKFDPKYAGGALMDMIIYNVHLIYHLFGKPSNSIYFANIENGIDTSGLVLMDYISFKGLAVGGMDSDAKSFFEVQGEHGYIRSDYHTNEISNLTLNIKGDETKIEKNINLRMSYEIEMFHKLFTTNNYDQVYKNFENSIEVVRIVDNVLTDNGLDFKDIL